MWIACKTAYDHNRRVVTRWLAPHDPDDGEWTAVYPVFARKFAGIGDLANHFQASPILFDTLDAGSIEGRDIHIQRVNPMLISFGVPAPTNGHQANGRAGNGKTKGRRK